MLTSANTLSSYEATSSKIDDAEALKKFNDTFNDFALANGNGTIENTDFAKKAVEIAGWFRVNKDGRPKIKDRTDLDFADLLRISRNKFGEAFGRLKTETTPKRLRPDPVEAWFELTIGGKSVKIKDKSGQEIYFKSSLYMDEDLISNRVYFSLSNKSDPKNMISSLDYGDLLVCEMDKNYDGRIDGNEFAASLFTNNRYGLNEESDLLKRGAELYLQRKA